MFRGKSNWIKNKIEIAHSVQSYTLCVKIHTVCKLHIPCGITPALCVKLHTVCKITHYV